jgi:cobalamin-dependent methionine synthase I
MIIVGELINASRKAVAPAIENQDAGAVADLAEKQSNNGADYIDVNAGVFPNKEGKYLKWIVETVQQKTDRPCCIDSPNPAAIEAALAVHKGTAMINSISLEKNRYDALMPLLAGTDLKVIALCMSDEGMPESADDRVAIAEKLVNGLVKHNIPLENIYVDPLVQPVSTNSTFGHEFLSAVSKIMTTFDGCHTICGLSNISYGLPERKLLNRTFVSMAIAAGLDAAIINPLDVQMTSNIAAASAIAGKDDFCLNYISAYRAGKLEVMSK